MALQMQGIRPCLPPAALLYNKVTNFRENGPKNTGCFRLSSPGAGEAYWGPYNHKL